jgi:hypothetical protein
MPDFITFPCALPNCKCIAGPIACGSITNLDKFGLRDDQPPALEPAYIDTANPTEWVAEVTNNNRIDVTFKAVDRCVPLFRANGDQESRCDGFLLFGQNVIFVELKDRTDTLSLNEWVEKGRKQLTATITNFIQFHNPTNYIFSVAHVCNKQRPLAVAGINTEVQRFKNDTKLLLNNQIGVLLVVDRKIII